MPEEYLVLGDVDGIQHYVFASARLREMVGASLIVRKLHDDVVPEVREGLEAGPGSSTAEVRPVRNSGGSLCYIVRCECGDDSDCTCADAADRFARKLRDRFAEISRGGRLSVTPPVEGGFGELEKARVVLERIKRRGGAVAEPQMAPYFRRCSSCGEEPAVEEHPNAGLLGERCRQKREVGDQAVGGDQASWWLKKWKRQQTDEDCSDVRAARHFEEIAGDRLLGILVADVDRLGAESHDLLSEFEEDSEKELAYRLLAKHIEYRMTSAVAEALSTENVSLQTDDDGNRVLPAQVLLTGGDDVAVALPGSVAFSVARSLSAAFAGASQEPSDLLDGVENPRIGGLSVDDRETVAEKVTNLSPGVSAAVAVTRPHFPIRDSHELASSLLGRAKRTARMRDWAHGGLHYAVVSEAAAELSVLEDDWWYGPEGNGTDAADSGLWLTGRPYSMDGPEAGSSGTRPAGSLRRAIEILSANDFSRTKLAALRRRFTVVWLREQGFPADPDRPEVRQARQRLEHEYRIWRERVGRREEDDTVWRRVEGELGIDHGRGQSSPWFANSQDEPCRTPVPDLADALDLWAP